MNHEPPNQSMHEIEITAEKFGILDQIPLGVCILRSDFIVLFWNRCLEDWTHLSRGQILGHKISDYFGNLNHPRYEMRLKSIFSGGPPTIFSAQLHPHFIPAYLPDGQRRIQRTTVTAIPGLTEGDYYALLSIQDITELSQQVQDYRKMRDRALAEVQERQRAEATLRSQEEQLQAVFDAVPGFVSWINSDLRYLGVNRHLADTFNLTPDHFIGQDVGFMKASPGFAEFMRKFIASSELAASQVIEAYINNTTSSYLIVAQKYQQGHAAVSVGIDITDRKQAEEEVRKALAKEKELSELKSRFVTMTSHEFRTPLTTILSSAELLEHYGHKWSDNKKLTHLRRIQGTVKHLVQVLEDVTLIGKAEAGKLQLQPVPLDLVGFCRSLVEELQLSLGQHHSLVFTHQCPNLNVCMDEKLLRHILTNLISNAIKYSPDYGMVTLSLVCHTKNVIFKIKDQGIGIPLADQEKLFEAFHRAQNVGNISGTGLGLAIVKRAVDLQGGEIAINSQVGEGTTFTVTLPLSV
jgi:PAS domain S-box-containing protein